MQRDDFEERLRRQPLRQLPGEWRNDILSAANAAAKGGEGRCAVSSAGSPAAHSPAPEATRKGGLRPGARRPHCPACGSQGGRSKA